MHKLDFIFFNFGGQISANTTGSFNSFCIYTATWVVYKLVIMTSLMDCPARQLCEYFLSTVLETFVGKTQSDYKANELIAVARNTLYCKGISAI